MDKQSRIYVADHRGMVGSALMRRLAAGGYLNLLTRSRGELDLLNQAVMHAFLREGKPDFIFMAPTRPASNTCAIWVRAASIRANARNRSGRSTS